MCPEWTDLDWSRRRDLNPRPAGYETRACEEPALSSSAYLRVTARLVFAFAGDRSRHRRTLETDAHASAYRHAERSAQINASSTSSHESSVPGTDRSFRPAPHYSVRRLPSSGTRWRKQGEFDASFVKAPASVTQPYGQATGPQRPGALSKTPPWPSCRDSGNASRSPEDRLRRDHGRARALPAASEARQDDAAEGRRLRARGAPGGARAGPPPRAASGSSSPTSCGASTRSTHRSPGASGGRSRRGLPRSACRARGTS